MKCRDCGEEKPSKTVTLTNGRRVDSIVRERSEIRGVCDACSDNRRKLMSALESCSIDMETFKELQRARAGPPGTMKKVIEKALQG